MLLNGSSNSALSKLACEMMERHYHKGQIFYMPGDPGETVFLLKTGRAEQYHLSPDGRKFVTNILEPGDIFGATALARNESHHVFAEALDDCVVLVLSRRRLRELALREPQTTLLLIETLAQRLRNAEDRLQALVFEPIPVRLARCLLEISDNAVVEGYSHQDLSEMLGTYRETVTVVLNRFKKDGLIDIDRRRIQILDCAGLQRVAYSQNGSQHESPTAYNNGTIVAAKAQSTAA